MDNIVEFTGGGLKCDNPSCDWEDKSITFEDYPNWVGKGCPKCGENVLTEEDYNNAVMLKAVAEQINNIPKDVLESMNENLNKESIEESDIFKDAEGLELLDDKEGEGSVTIGFESKDGKLRARYFTKDKKKKEE